MIGVVLLFLFGCAYWYGRGPTPIFWSIQAAVLASIAVLFLRPGAPGPNAYGPPPPPLRVSGTCGGIVGLWIAVGLLGVNLCLGWSVVAWQDGMRRQAEWRERMPTSDANEAMFEEWQNQAQGL